MTEEAYEFPPFVDTDAGQAALRELALLALELMDDVNFAHTTAQEQDQPARRGAVRAAFAYFEGVLYAMKQFALTNSEASFSLGELILLNEKSYSLDARGRVHEGDARLAMLSSLRFTFEMLARALDRPFTLDVSGPGWQSMVAALKIRHRVTHPKSLASIAVTDKELEVVDAAGQWFTISFKQLVLQRAGPR